MLYNKIQKGYIQLAIILGTLLLFILTNNIIFGILIAIEIFLLVGVEVKEGAKKHGWKNEVVDTLIAFGVALGFWLFLSFILNTSSPISAVVSCSMLPNLQRGDFVIVQGSPIKAIEINMTNAEFESFSNEIITTNKGEEIKGSLYSQCLGLSKKGELLISNNILCKEFYENPKVFSEKKGPVTFFYSTCSLKTKNGVLSSPCVNEFEFKGQNYSINTEGDTVVYQPAKEDVYSMIGDIVHRTQFIINVGEDKYYITKGDNNPIFDVQVYDNSFQAGNKPAKDLRGKVLMRIPYLGYLKLFISGFFEEPGQCSTLLTYS